MTFSGFAASDLAFLTGLAVNNDRDWFAAQRAAYDDGLKPALAALIADTSTACAARDLPLSGDPKRSVFRIHRDTRFSKDKTPYKTRFSAGITPHDKRRPSAGGGSTYYFHIERSGKLGFGVGEYLPPAARLKAIREHIVNDATGFAKVLKNKHLGATYNDMLEEDKLQRPPKGFDPDHPHVDYLKLKSFFVWTEVDLDLNAPDQLVPRLAQGFQDAFALVAWLRSVPEPQEETTNT